MQTAQLDGDAGTHIEFAYIDSGAPPGSDTYTTLVCVHGHTYHAHNFSRLLLRAHAQNLRVIAFNRRDYTGSTPFSPAELAAISGTDGAEHVGFLRARGLEVARFLLWVVSEKNIPKANANGTQGGLALLGWSLGNITTMAFLRHLRSFPRDLVDALAPYLRTFFIYEAGYSSLGYPNPEGAYHPLRDTSIPPRLRGITFGTWVSSYFTHPIYASTQDGSWPERTMSALQILTPERATARRACTLDTLTPSELTACVDPTPASRSEPAFLGVREETMRDQMCGSLLLDHPSSSIDTDESAALLPLVKVRVVYGYATTWSIIWCVWELEKDLERWRAEGRRVRPLAFIPIEESNHFFHWDDPELFLKVAAEGIRS
ncbi:hypothetical protein M0805_009725 [Coniferiporia weirii]|nr:hypothetical protein M0805_009725 [Coniferiporia weirii]